MHLQEWTYSLPENKEDYKFDGNEFQERAVFGKIQLQLNIKLEEAKHGNQNSQAFDYGHLIGSLV